MKVRDAIKIMQESGWIYEGSTKIDGTRTYMMRQYSSHPHSTQTVIYFTTYGLRREATKEMLRHETHFT
jgi:hypothetical protein